MSSEYEPGLVSVIVPTYNRAHLIIETLDSVFAQTYRPIELLIVDDGSTDNTADVVRQWERERQQEGFAIRFITQENRGAPAARNLGLIESRGEFIQFLDSDDLIHPSKIDSQVEIMQAGHDFVWSQNACLSDARVKQLNLTPLSDRCPYGEADPRDFANSLNTVVGLYRRGLCESIGCWNETLKKWQDWEYNLRLAKSRPKSAYQEIMFTFTRVHDSGQISSINRQSLENALHAIHEVERVLCSNSGSASWLSNAIARRYDFVQCEALTLGLADLVHQAARAGLRCQASVYLTAKFYFLCAASHVPGLIASGVGQLPFITIRAVRRFKRQRFAQKRAVLDF